MLVVKTTSLLNKTISKSNLNRKYYSDITININMDKMYKTCSSTVNNLAVCLTDGTVHLFNVYENSFNELSIDEDGCLVSKLNESNLINVLQEFNHMREFDRQFMPRYGQPMDQYEQHRHDLSESNRMRHPYLIISVHRESGPLPITVINYSKIDDLVNFVKLSNEDRINDIINRKQ